MNPHLTETFITVFLVLIIICAVIICVRRMKKGGGCCGEHESAVRSRAAKRNRKQRYTFHVDIKITGMTCSNCAKRVENALNDLDGVRAKVDRNTDTAHVMSAERPDLNMLFVTIARTGYIAEVIPDRTNN